MEKSIEERKELYNSEKYRLRCLISNLYDLQEMRIQAGNRLVQSFYSRKGIRSIDCADNKDVTLLATLKADYKRITDGIAETKQSTKKFIKLANASKEPLEVIQDDIDYKLVDAYMLLVKSEEEQTKVVDNVVKNHPMWDAFFKDVKGCGTLMSAVCLAYLDIYKARYVSSFFRYCGVDTVLDTDKQGNTVFREADNPTVKVIAKYRIVDEDGIILRPDTKFKSNEPMVDDVTGEEYYLTTDNKRVHKVQDTDVLGNPIYTECESGEDYVGEVVTSEHGRSMSDTEMVEYIDKNGNTALKRSLTYNPFVKAKLIGVLSGCLIKAKDPTYSAIYYDYKKRLELSDKYKGASAGHRDAMAKRYMVKQFLRNLWTTWRTAEGLEVNYPYEVAKLGNAPHKYNKYQCDMAEKSLSM